MSVSWRDIRRMSVSQQDIQRRRFAGPECLSAGAIFGECRSHSKTFKGSVLPAPNVGLLARYSANVDLLARYSANVGLLARYSANVCLTARHSKAAFFGASSTFVNVWCQVSKTFAETFGGGVVRRGVR